MDIISTHISRHAMYYSYYSIILLTALVFSFIPVSPVNVLIIQDDVCEALASV